MTIISKATGGLSLASCIYDMHKCGLRCSDIEGVKAANNVFLQNQIGSMKMDTYSYKNAQIKNWFVRNNVFQPFAEISGRVSGYLTGFFTSAMNYVPNILLSAVALFAKNKTLANISAVAAAALEGWNVLQNTILNKDKTDYLNL